MEPPHILLTDPLHPDAHTHLAAWARVSCLPAGLSPDAGDAALREAVTGADGLIVRRRLPADLFDRPHTLRCVMRHGVGLDFIPVDSATAHGIPVGFTPAVNANAVAEYVFAAFFAHTRQLAAFDASVRGGDWPVRMTASARTFEIAGRRLGIVGYGAIGKRIGQIAQHGFGMSLAVSTSKPAGTVLDGVTTVPLEDVFSGCDFIVIACPLTAATRGLVDRALLGKAKPGALLVNVGRGPVIVEADLAAALAAGELGGAVLDVFEQQPLPPDSPLRKLPNVVLTPHLAGMTDEAERAMGTLASDTLAAMLLRGERPPNIVNPEVFAR